MSRCEADKPIKLVHVLLHEAPHDVTSVLGAYSTEELAVKAKERAIKAAWLGGYTPEEEDLKIYKLEIDEDDF